MSPTVSFALMTLGAHHGDEVPADLDGQTWLAAVQRGDAWHLEAGRVQVTAVADPVLDQNKDDRSGRLVAVPDLGGVASFLVRGEGLVPGPLAMADAAPRPLFPGDQQVLTLGDDEVSLQAFGVANPNRWGVTVIERYHLVASGSRGQVDLFAAAPLDKEGQVPRVVFAADLDRDGRMDLVVETSDHYNVHQLALFLSSAAGAGAPLAPVATHRAVGG